MKYHSIEELRSWVEAHQDDGCINEVSIILDEGRELRGGYVNPDLYDKALTRAAPFGYTKSQIATVGATRLLSNAILKIGEELAFEGLSLDDSRGTEFRAFLPQGLSDQIKEHRDRLKWSNSIMMQLILSYFVHDPGIETIYRRWIADLCKQHGLTEQEVEKKIYDRRRIQAATVRLKESEKRGTIVRDRKIAT